MTSRIDGRRAVMSDLAPLEDARARATTATLPAGELRLTHAAGKSEPSPSVASRKSLGAVPAPIVTDASATRLTAACARIAVELDCATDAALDPAVARALAPRLAAVRAMTVLVRELLALRDDVAARRGAETRA